MGLDLGSYGSYRSGFKSNFFRSNKSKPNLNPSKNSNQYLNLARCDRNPIHYHL